MKKLLPCLALLLSLFSGAATVDTLYLQSHAMNTGLKAVVIRPDSYEKSPSSYPVVYLLHGYSGWYSNWILRVPELKDYADQHQLLIVCPEGRNSWYLDSPADSSIRFETHITRELIPFIDARYKTIASRGGRAITGLSMGGHGGLYLGLRHPELFGACGSMSGGVDLRPFPKNWDLNRLLGDTARHRNNWEEHSVINVAARFKTDSTAILIDCGVNDFFIGVNRALHQQLLDLKIPHDYIERPGEHNWPYWANAIRYQLLFFRTAFSQAAKKAAP